MRSSSVMEEPMLSDSPYSSKRAPYYLDIEGTAEILVTGMPFKILAGKDADSDNCMYAYAWNNEEAGVASKISFDSTMSNAGGFRLRLPVSSNDPDLGKIQVCDRTLDQQSNNKRTFTFAVGAFQLDKLMETGLNEVVLSDHFESGNMVNISLRARNAADFANYKGGGTCERLKISPGSVRPLITFRRSALWDIPKSNQMVEDVSAAFRRGMKKNKVKVGDGCALFCDGQSR